MSEPRVVTLPELPRSDSTAAEEAINKLFADRHWPTSPAACARLGFEAARRLAQQQRTLTVAAQAGAGNLLHDLYLESIERELVLEEELRQLKEKYSLPPAIGAAQPLS